MPPYHKYYLSNLEAKRHPNKEGVVGCLQTLGRFGYEWTVLITYREPVIYDYLDADLNTQLESLPMIATSIAVKQVYGFPFVFDVCLNSADL